MKNWDNNYLTDFLEFRFAYWNEPKMYSKGTDDPMV